MIKIETVHEIVSQVKDAIDEVNVNIKHTGARAEYPHVIVVTQDIEDGKYTWTFNLQLNTVSLFIESAPFPLGEYVG